MGDVRFRGVAVMDKGFGARIKYIAAAFAGKSARSPVYLLRLLCAYGRGLAYVVYYRLTRRSVRIDFPFAAYGSVRIQGPGTVRIGKRCFVVTNVFEGLTIVTSRPESTVVIGEGSLLGGLTIRCRGRIEIGPRLMTARSLIQDSLFVHPHQMSTKSAVERALAPSEISLGENIWLGGECIVLGGCRIGSDSVVSAGCWCSGVSTGDYSLVGGNPARKALSIERLLKLKGTS